MEKSKGASLRNTRVFITGANGFIGHHLVRRLLDQGASVSVLGRKKDQYSLPVTEYTGDLKDRGTIESCLTQADPEIIFHLAAYKERSPKMEAFATAVEENLMGSLNLFSAMGGLKNLRSAVVTGTAEEYGNNPSPFTEGMRESPVSSYSYSKLCVTQLCQVLSGLHGLPLVVIRPTLAYGPGQPGDMFLPALIQALAADQPFPMSPGGQTRDFIYIDDLVDALLLAAQRPGLAGEIINVGSGLPLKIADLALKTEQMMAKKDLIRLGAIPYRAGEIMEYFVENGKAKKLLGWEPKVGIEEGLRRTIDHYLGARVQ